MLAEEFERHWANFDGNLRDIMDTVIKELKSDEDGMKLRQEQGKDFLQPKGLLMSLFTLILSIITYCIMPTNFYSRQHYFAIYLR